MKSIIIKILIGIIATGTVVTTSIVVVPKVVKQVEENRIQKEKEEDLKQVEISLSQDELILPYLGHYNENIYENTDSDILENTTDYTKYQKFVSNSQGGNLNITGNVDINAIGDYEVIYTVTTEKGNSKTAKLNVKVQDMMRPEIYIENETIEVEKGQEVNVLDGVTVGDNVDTAEDLMSKIEVEGTVDTNTVGEYKITYRVKDTAGWSCERTRTYKVEEKPHITIGANYNYNKNGYSISLCFTSSSNFEISSGSEASECYITKGTYKVSGNNITLTITYDSGEIWEVTGELYPDFKPYTEKVVLLSNSSVKYTNRYGDSYTLKK